jgi:hypothetical protein
VYGLPVTSVDNGYALLWGHELASLDVPDYEAAGASTPHPLATAVGFVLAPLGADGAFLALRLLAALWFGLMAWSVWALARTLAGRAAAAVAVAVVVTSLVFTGAAMGSMIDVPFVALVLAATARLVRRPGEPWLPLGLLALAGSCARRRGCSQGRSCCGRPSATARTRRARHGWSRPRPPHRCSGRSATCSSPATRCGR